MNYIKFGDPQWLDLIWLGLGMFLFGMFFIIWAQKMITKKFGKRSLTFLTPMVSLTRKKISVLLQSLIVVFFALSLARPQMGSRRTEVKQTGLEMIIALDVSNSMLAEDDKPSRLEHAKHELSHLLDLMPGHRVGVIAFAGSAVLISPITTDHSAIKMYLESLNVNSVSTQGTSFKEVVDEAIRAFERGGVETANGTKPSRVLLLATDGEDNETQSTSYTKKALDQGVKIFALGFGSARGAPIPERDDRGQLIGYKKDRTGQPVLSVPSDEGLTKLVKAGGGSYYHSTPSEGEVKNLVADFSQLQLVDFKSQMTTEYDEKFQIPLILALILGLLELTLGDRKKSRRKWFGRFENAASALILSTVLTAPSGAEAFGPPLVESNNEGLKNYQDEKYQDAVKSFSEALSRDPFHPMLHFNLGDALFKAGEPEKALAEFEAAAKQGEPEQKFMALFNAGNVALEMKDTDRALKYYQRALELKPESKEVKTNIELALRDKKGGGGSQNNKGESNKNDPSKQDQDKQDQNQDDKSKKDQKGQGPEPRPSPRPQPKPFKSQEISEQDVKRLLEELKKREEKIRAQQNLYNKKNQDRNIEKDW